MKSNLLKSISIIFLISIINAGFCLAQQNDLIKHPYCPLCGMDREQFAHSRMLLIYEYNIELEFGACSLHCGAIEMARNMDKAPKKIYVGDYNSKKLIDAQTAYWVIGGKKTGVMTRRAKWAFEEKAQAEQFIQKHEGKLIDFHEALKAAYSDMYYDNRMIVGKRERKEIKKKNAQMPPLPGTDVKCPVCGMFVAKFPHWVGVIRFKDDTLAYFDGAKDLFKYYFDLKKYAPGKTQAEIRDIYVTEYYSTQLINAKDALFVIGSDILGPMGKELIPFVKIADTQEFMMDHKGDKILKFNDVTMDIIKTLD